MTIMRVASDPAKTAMCLGKITGDRRIKIQTQKTLKEQYLRQARQKIEILLSLGVNTFLFVSWDYYDVLICKMLKEIDNSRGGKFKFVMPIGVILKGEKFLKNPDPDRYFQFIIDQASEKIELPDELMADQLILNVTYVLYDGEEMTGHMPMFIEKATNKKRAMLRLDEKWATVTDNAF